MNKSRTIKVFYGLLAMGLLLLCFPSISQAYGHRSNVTYRPLSDWTLNNPRVVLGYTTNWDLLPDGWIIRPNFAVEDSGEYYGSIREKVLSDGRAELTVYIFGKNSPRTVYQLQDWFDFFGGGPYPNDILENLKMDFFAVYKFILPGPNEEIPFIFDISEWISGMIIGFASGTFTEYAGNFGFTADEEGRVFLHQSFYIDEQGQEIWPNEIIKIN